MTQQPSEVCFAVKHGQTWAACWRIQVVIGWILQLKETKGWRGLERKSDGECDGRGVRESGTRAYFPRVKPGVTVSTKQTAPAGCLHLETALSLLLPACPKVTWAGSRAAAPAKTHTVVKATETIFGFKFITQNLTLLFASDVTVESQYQMLHLYPRPGRCAPWCHDALLCHKHSRKEEFIATLCDRMPLF